MPVSCLPRSTLSPSRGSWLSPPIPHHLRSISGVVISTKLLSLSPHRMKRMMEDKKTPKSNSIPSWQHAEPSTIPSHQPLASLGSSLQAPSSSRDSLLHQAATFLLDDSVRDAPLERKRSFLRSKGLNIDEIDRLLRAPENKTPSNTEAEIKNQIPEVSITGFVNPKFGLMLKPKAVYPDCIIAERKQQGLSATVFSGTFSFIP